MRRLERGLRGLLGVLGVVILVLGCAKNPFKEPTVEEKTKEKIADLQGVIAKAQDGLQKMKAKSREYDRKVATFKANRNNLKALATKIAEDIKAGSEPISVRGKDCTADQAKKIVIAYHHALKTQERKMKRGEEARARAGTTEEALLKGIDQARNAIGMLNDKLEELADVEKRQEVAKEINEILMPIAEISGKSLKPLIEEINDLIDKLGAEAEVLEKENEGLILKMEMDDFAALLASIEGSGMSDDEILEGYGVK